MISNPSPAVRAFDPDAPGPRPPSPLPELLERLAAALAPLADRSPVDLRLRAGDVCLHLTAGGRPVAAAGDPEAPPLTATDLSGDGGQPPPAVKILPVEVPEDLPVKRLSPGEAAVLLVLEAERGALLGREMARRLGKPYGQVFRKFAAKMMHVNGLIGNTPGDGYSATLKGRLSLAEWKARRAGA